MRFESDLSCGLPESRTVYVVDDDSELRRSLQYLLEAMGIAVCPYSCGVQFLREVEHLEPSPIILDVRMPGTDGAQVLRELSRRLIKWPVVIFSASGEIEDIELTLSLGAVAFLKKPARSSDLVKALNEAFENLVH